MLKGVGQATDTCSKSHKRDPSRLQVRSHKLCAQGPTGNWVHGAKALSSKMSLEGPFGQFGTASANFCFLCFWGLLKRRKTRFAKNGEHALNHFLDLTESKLHS